MLIIIRCALFNTPRHTSEVNTPTPQQHIRCCVFLKSQLNPGYYFTNTPSTNASEDKSEALAE
jgi:hypothetical protein